MKREIAVTGMGIVSPVGNNLKDFWTSLVEGRSGVGPVTRFDASSLDSRVAAEVKNFDPSLWMDRKDARKMALFSQFAVAAAVQACSDSGLGLSEEEMRAAGYAPERVAVILGNGIGGLDVFEESHAKLLESGPDRLPPMTIPLMIANEAAANVALRLGIKGPAYTQVTACASGTDAIGLAIDLLRSGRVDVVLAGGCEAAVTRFAMAGFCKLKALSTARNNDPATASRPFAASRDGFVIGEGAGILVLEDSSKAKSRGARIYALASGYGATCDAYHLTAPHPQGIEGARALTLAMNDAELSPEEIGYYNAHGTATQLNDPIESTMVKRAFGPASAGLKISSTKSMLGHGLGAAGAMEAIVCVKAIETGILPPTINLDRPDIEAGCDLDYIPNRSIERRIDAALTASLGFGGHNAALAFRRAPR
jgi:3-oxoacyl-[acyl-carrier-protein] synthase II